MKAGSILAAPVALLYQRRCTTGGPSSVDVVSLITEEKEDPRASVAGESVPLDLEEKKFCIGVLLPHTKGPGAKTASERVVSALGNRLRRSAIAVYPDDSTDWTKLVRMLTE